MFLKYIFFNLGQYFVIWVILTIINQVVFFGACLAPYCILASIPHVSIISLVIMYFSYKASMGVYDNDTGLNEFGYDKDGYNKNNYDINGYHKNGYHKNGYDRNGYDRNGYDEYGYDRNGFNNQGLNEENEDKNGKGKVGRFFTDEEYKKNAKELNQKSKENNKYIQEHGLSDKVARKHSAWEDISKSSNRFDMILFWIALLVLAVMFIWDKL